MTLACFWLLLTVVMRFAYPALAPLIFLALGVLPDRAHAQLPTPKAGGATPAGGAPPTARKVVANLGVDLGPDDQRLLGGYRLSLDKLDKFEAATKRLQDAVKTNPTLKSQLDTISSGAGKASLGDSISRIEVNGSAVVSLMKEAGTTPRDFILTPFSLYLAGKASVAKQGNPAVTLPPYAPGENVAFFDANRSRIEAMFKSIQGQGR